MNLAREYGVSGWFMVSSTYPNAYATPVWAELFRLRQKATATATSTDYTTAGDRCLVAWLNSNGIIYFMTYTDSNTNYNVAASPGTNVNNAYVTLDKYFFVYFGYSDYLKEVTAFIRCIFFVNFSFKLLWILKI